MYQSLDAIDGKQARRTGTSNPLGELFDHGCDSISTGINKFFWVVSCLKVIFYLLVFVALSACVAVELGQYPTWMFFQCFCAIVLFYCAHWQTYVSGTMKFGKVDVTEAQCCIMVIHIISGTFGSSFWATEVFLIFITNPFLDRVSLINEMYLLRPYQWFQKKEKLISNFTHPKTTLSSKVLRLFTL